MSYMLCPRRESCINGGQEQRSDSYRSNKDSIMPAMQGKDTSMKIGMCDICYVSGVELELTEVGGTIQSPFGVVTIPLCKKCRE